MNWFRRRNREQDLDRELRSHLELETAEQRDGGRSLEDARYAAWRQLGNATLLKEDMLFETGHAGPVQQYMKETLGWFQKYLGPTGRCAQWRRPASDGSSTGFALIEAGALQGYAKTRH